MSDHRRLRSLGGSRVVAAIGLLAVPALGGAAFAAANSVSDNPDPQIVIPAGSTSTTGNPTTVVPSSSSRSTLHPAPNDVGDDHGGGGSGRSGSGSGRDGGSDDPQPHR